MSTHIIDLTISFCERCRATYTQIQEGISCGQIRCCECTLLRTCWNGVCQECLENINNTISKAYGEALAKSSQQIIQEAIVKWYADLPWYNIDKDS